MPDELVQEMCTRLGVPQPSDMAGVTALYRAWCEQIPFDSISKALALREGVLPPGSDPADLSERWLTTGLGGTCWGHASAMAAVLEAGDVHCRVGLDRFLIDDRVDFHSFLVVEDGDRRLALDVTHGSGDPLPIEAGAQGTHPAYPVEFVDDGDGRLLHRFVRMSRAPARSAPTGCCRSTSTPPISARSAR
jgi:N-hydroxyarylamine O-acetyltransferase